MLDLGSLESVRAFAEHVRPEHDGLDLLINNAGRDGPAAAHDRRRLRAAVRHQPPRALRARRGVLIGALEKGEGAGGDPQQPAHRIGKIDFDDLQRERRYSRWRAYGQSKLSNLMFALELDRRLRAAGSPVLSLAAHPGYAATNLQSAAAPLMDRLVMTVANKVIAQSAEMGALPTLYAATVPDVESGMFIGPDGIGEQRGYPTPVGPSRAATDADVAARLWTVSEELTGVRFELSAGAAA